MVGFCYHFALLHCALLRATGTPANPYPDFQPPPGAVAR
jgi:transglutaminase-like putative cysteine protease